MSSHEQILKLLADGKYHSGQELGELLGISRAAIWKGIKKIKEDYSLDVFAVRGKGYRLPGPIDLLDAQSIKSQLGSATSGQLSELLVFQTIESTNRYLMEKSQSAANSGSVVLAETQTAGRGRRGRQWVSPFGSNLYLSISWRYLHGPSQLACLGLGVAVAIVRVLQQLGMTDVGVKWPNDIYWHGKKLAGILLEMRGEAEGPSTVVVGVGLNVAMQSEHMKSVDQPWTDIETVSGTTITRNTLAAAIIDEIFSILSELPEKNTAMLEEWQTMDVLQEQSIQVIFPNKVISGKALGINQDGALRVLSDGKEMTFHSGEVSIRASSS